MNKKCPMSFNNQGTEHPENVNHDCVEGNCAWWDYRGYQCVLMTIAEKLEDVARR